MSIKEILGRIKRLEERNTAEDMVTLICMENGRECRKCMPVHEACMMALKQGTAHLFGYGEVPENRIIGVESGDDDGFIIALIGGVEYIDPAELEGMVEV